MTTTNNDGGKDIGKIKLATIQYEDGHEEPMTWDDLKALLFKAWALEREGKHPEDVWDGPKIEQMTLEELDILKQTLFFLLEFNITEMEGWSAGGPDDPKRKARIRELFHNTLQLVVNYLETHEPKEEIPQVDNITKLLRGEIEYMVAPRPRGYNELLKISSVGEQGIQYREDENRVRISFPNRLAIEEQKIRQACELAFLDKNFHGAKKNLLTRVTVPIDEIMEVLGRPNNPENKKKFKQQLSPKRKGKEGILDDIKNTYIEIRAAGKKGEGPGDWVRLNIGQACGIVNDHIYFQFSEDYARYINTGILKPYHQKLMRLGSRQFPLPYYVAQKMSDQYFYYANQRRGANDTLQIKTLLDHCKEVIDYAYILEVDPTHWKSKIKAKYERALNEIQAAGVFKWEYCGKALKEIPQAKIDAADFYTWSELYIVFQLIPNEPTEQAQRLEKRQERIERAKERKELEDAKILVEADKIRKRKRKKKTPKKEKGESGCPNKG